MNQYIGTKVVTAKPMNRADYNTYRGWELPANEDGNDEGYLVEYSDGGKPNDARHRGYISWSPKAQFDRAYHVTEGLDFGDAIRAMINGKRVARSGWNGKGMWLSLSGDIEGRMVPYDKFWSDNNAEYAMTQENDEARVLPCITMKTADGSILMGWLASQTDMLARDWAVV